MFGAVCLANGIMMAVVKSVLDEVLSLRPAIFCEIDACVWNAKCVVGNEAFDWFSVVVGLVVLGLMVRVFLAVSVCCVWCCFWKWGRCVVFLVEAECWVIVDLVDVEFEFGVCFVEGEHFFCCVATVEVGC